jgi:hypothetical protein
MSERASAADAFVPLDPTSAPGAKAGAAPVGLKVVPKSGPGSDFTPLQVPGVPHVHSAAGVGGKPIVTLERDGERVTGIRIECVCGQVIELACSY